MRSLRATEWRAEDDLFRQVGEFLSAHALPVEPYYYAFAYRIISKPESDLARATARLASIRGRLSPQDIVTLGSSTKTAAPAPAPAAAQPESPAEPGAEERAKQLVAETQAQVDGFATMMRAMQDETRDFGRDLAQGVAAISGKSRLNGLDGVAQITTTMIERIRDAEVRLAHATEEADSLRTKLAEANDTARRDPLTGLPNRRAFDEAFASRQEAAGPHCLAVVDIDRFKRINDQFGHGVGDRVLSAIANVLSQQCAPHLVVRHGGEEFAVLLSGIELSAATIMLDRARGVTADKHFRSRDSQVELGQITFSAGVTAIQPGEPQDQAFARADRLLYAAKQDGRDRIHAA
jgi:diguanylate cyclase